MLECLFLPLPYLGRVHAIVGGDLVRTAHTFDRFQHHFALESRAILLPLSTHRSSTKVPILYLIQLSSFWGVSHESVSQVVEHSREAYLRASSTSKCHADICRFL